MHTRAIHTRAMHTRAMHTRAMHTKMVARKVAIMLLPSWCQALGRLCCVAVLSLLTGASF
jgi:hypothetical protein